MRSHEGHKALFTGFSGAKVSLASKADAVAFVEGFFDKT